MTKNYMADVANMLGVELEEEFMINGSDKVYKFFKNGLCFQCGGAWLRADSILIGLIKGEYKIVKLPWQPKYGDKYYYPGAGFRNICSAEWRNSVLGLAYKEAGLIFKTYEECEAALPELRKKYLGGVMIMYKPLADSTLMGMTKKDIIEQLRIAEHNYQAVKETVN